MYAGTHAALTGTHTPLTSTFAPPQKKYSQKSKLGKAGKKRKRGRNLMCTFSKINIISNLEWKKTRKMKIIASMPSKQ